MNKPNVKLLKIISLIFFIFFSLTFIGCSGKESQQNLHIVVSLGKDALKQNNKPPLISITIDNKEIIHEVPISSAKSINTEIKLGKGMHSILVSEKNTGASARSIVADEKEQYFRALFFRESSSMGYFDIKTLDKPFDEGAKVKQGGPSDDSIKKSDDLDDKFNALRKESRNSKIHQKKGKS
jgi:hypothetical protein